MTALITFAFLAATAPCQLTSPANGQDIVDRLMPDENVQNLPPRLTPAMKNRTIRELQQAQIREFRLGERGSIRRAAKIAFLLALLGSNYERNRDYLFGRLRKCSPPEAECDYMIGDYLIALFKKGHKEVLRALFDCGLTTYAATLSETLGDFYAELVVGHPTEFLDGIEPLSSRKQKRLCGLAGSADGGGMSPRALRKVRAELGAIDGDLAKRCLREIELANRPDRQ